jgi:hypothetical protein
VLFGSYSFFCSFLFTFYSLFSLHCHPSTLLAASVSFLFPCFPSSPLSHCSPFQQSTSSRWPYLSITSVFFSFFFFLNFFIYFFSLFLFFFTFTSQPKRLQLAFQSFMLQASAYKPQHFSFKTQIIHYIS